MSLKAIGSVSLLNVNDGQQGEQGLSVAKEEVQYYLSTSDSSLSGGSWQDTQPQVTSGTYLWERIKTTRSDNSVIYSDAVYSRTTSGLVSTVDNIKNQITNKVWQSDISTQINSYDSSTVSTIRDRVSGTETNITGITARVSDVESTTSNLGTRMTAAESSITQNADNINLKVSKDSVISEINQSPEEITINANRVNIEGATIFSSGRLSAESLSENMLLDVYAPSAAKINAKYNRYFSESGNSSTVCSFVPAGDEKLPDPNAKYFVRIENTETGKPRGFCFYNCPNKENAIGLIVGETYKASCWVRQLTGSSNFTIYIGGDGAGTGETDTIFVPTSKWQKFERVFTFNDRTKTSDVWSRLYFYNKAGNDIAGAGTGIGAIDMCGFKLERVNAITASGRNLCLRSADYNGWGKSSNVTFDGNVMTFSKTTTKKWRNAWQTVNLPYSIVRNQKITITYKIKAASGQIPCVVFSPGIANGETATRLKYRNRYTYTIANGEWQTVAMSAYITDKIFGSTATSGTPDYDNGYFHILVGTPDYYLEEVQIKEIMVALGSDPCAWSPAPEDSVAYTDESVNAIEIGGRNILRDSETMASMWYYSQTNATLVDGVVTLTGTSSSWTADLWTSKFDASVYDGAESIVSFDYKSTASCNIHRVYAGTSTDKDNSTWGRTKYVEKTFTIPSSGGEWKRYVMPVDKISVASLTTGSGDVVSGYLQFYNRTDNVVFQMRHIKFEKGNKPTQWSIAPEDVAPKTAAVSEEQYIYISKASGTSSVPVNNTWVTETGDKQNTWTTKRPTYNSSYPVLFVAKQKKVVSGAVTCTTPLKDDTTTIIDGGHITTGTIDASKVTVTNINASNIKAGTISVGHLPGDALNSNIEIGGKNLLCGTGTSVSKATTATTSYVVQSLYYTPNKVTLASLGFAANDEVTLSFDWKVTNATTYGNARIEWYGYKNSSSADTYLAPLINPFATFGSSNTSGHVSTTVKLTSTTINSKRIVLRIDNSALTLTISNLKLEKGNKATDWSYAPEDIQGSIDSVNNTISGVRGDLTQTQGNLSRIDSAVENLDGQMQTTYELASGAKSSADEANQKYDTISSIVDDYNNLRNYYLDFNPTPSGISGLTIGARNSDGSDNAFKTQITNDSLNFLQNGSAVAGINANEFFINQGTIETGLRVGNFVIFDEDGALNIKYEPRLEA